MRRLDTVLVNLQGLERHVRAGRLLTAADRLSLMEAGEVILTIRNLSIYNDVRHANVAQNVVAEAWGLTPARVCQIVATVNPQ